MEQDFYKGRLIERHELEVLMPNDEDCKVVHRVIYDELVRGRAEPVSRQAYHEVIARLVERGAEAVILGVHGNHVAGEARGQQRPTFRHHGHPRRSGRRDRNRRHMML